MRRGVAVICALVAAAGCRAGPVHPTAVSPSRRAASTAPRSPSQASEVLAAPVLRADLAEMPGRWDRVAFIPFGEDPADLGFKSFHESPSSLPSAFVVAPDSSFWIDDRWKRRVVHYSASGRYMGEAGPLQQGGWDLAMIGEEVYVLVEQASGTIGKVASGSVRHFDVTYGGAPLFVFQLAGTARGLVAEAAEAPPKREGDLGSFLLVDPSDPKAQLLPGLPLGGGTTFFNARSSATPAHVQGDQDFDFLFTSKEISQVQPVQFELIGHEGKKQRSLPAEVGLTEPLAVGDDVVMYVLIAPTRPDDADAFGGGRWLLRVGLSSILWERLPDPGIPAELQHRHLAVGPDGSMYLMVPHESGELILRRRTAGA